MLLELCSLQEPYELLRAKRKKERGAEEEAESEEQEEEVAAAEADAMQAGKRKWRDRRGHRRKAGHGCDAPFEPSCFLACASRYSVCTSRYRGLTGNNSLYVVLETSSIACVYVRLHMLSLLTM